MDTKQTSTPWTSYLFIVFLLGGCIILVLALFIFPPPTFFGGLRRLGAGLLLIGLGEWINHPRQEAIEPLKEGTSFQHGQHRRRNPSSLGSLLEIAGIILAISALADYLW